MSDHSSTRSASSTIDSILLAGAVESSEGPHLPMPGGPHGASGIAVLPTLRPLQWPASADPDGTTTGFDECVEQNGACCPELICSTRPFGTDQRKTGPSVVGKDVSAPALVDGNEGYCSPMVS